MIEGFHKQEVWRSIPASIDKAGASQPMVALKEVKASHIRL
jgi:hypothetical protein